MIDRGHELSVTKQACAVGIARSTVYYLPAPTSPVDLDLMKRIDRLHMSSPSQARACCGVYWLPTEERQAGVT